MAAAKCPSPSARRCKETKQQQCVRVWMTRFEPLPALHLRALAHPSRVLVLGDSVVTTLPSATWRSIPPSLAVWCARCTFGAASCRWTVRSRSTPRTATPSTAATRTDAVRNRLLSRPDSSERNSERCCLRKEQTSCSRESSTRKVPDTARRRPLPPPPPLPPAASNRTLCSQARFMYARARMCARTVSLEFTFHMHQNCSILSEFSRSAKASARARVWTGTAH